MSKELEALEDIILYLNASEPKGLYCENIKTIQQALQRLEEVDNENTNEALELFYYLLDHFSYKTYNPKGNYYVISFTIYDKNINDKLSEFLYNHVFTK